MTMRSLEPTPYFAGYPFQGKFQKKYLKIQETKN